MEIKFYGDSLPVWWNEINEFSEAQSLNPAHQ